ncbi:hypothetical protein [Streptomyces maremycinicus]|uniref:hypothetical protein n=1 Tax=Streptomyces maremycinicus TaxID=1679753 RepID=UPI0007895D5B|nr:hypothetical protein [Streptomyces sp. NBRC 110468]
MLAETLVAAAAAGGTAAAEAADSHLRVRFRTRRARQVDFGDRDAGGVVPGTTAHGPVALETGSRSRQDDHFGAAR